MGEHRHLQQKLTFLSHALTILSQSVKSGELSWRS